jgi:hypothetical protein
VLAALVLPPGFSIQIMYDPDAGPTNVIVTVLRDRRWAGEMSVEAARVDQPGALQRLVDSFTKTV